MITLQLYIGGELIEEREFNSDNANWAAREFKEEYEASISYRPWYIVQVFRSKMNIGRPRIDLDTEEKIISLKRYGKRQWQIAEELGVSEATVTRVLKAA